MLPQRKATRAVAVLVIIGMLASVVLASVASFYASSAPDGLERVAQDNGFADTAQESAAAGSPLADYSTGGDGRFSVGMAGLIGVVITAAAGFALFTLLAPRSSGADEQT